MEDLKHSTATGFGGTSRYYLMYRMDPAAARLALWNIFRKSKGRINFTAKLMGCSRNTVRDVVKRFSEERPRLNNMPSGHDKHGYRRPHR